MEKHEHDLAAVWHQERIPVVYRPGGKERLLVKLPYALNNGDWLRHDNRNRPRWERQFSAWSVPKSWFDQVVRRTTTRYGAVYVVQPFRKLEKCAPACWDALGAECECSCMGKYHGSRAAPTERWHVVSETFAVSWEEREYACRLLERPSAERP